MLINRCFVLIALLGLAGCPMKNADPETDRAGGAGGAAGAVGAGASAARGAAGQTVSAGAAGASAVGGAAGQTVSAGAAGEVPKVSSDAAAPDPGKPLAAGCAANSECASGFCVDSVCCESACDGQCETCHGAVGNVGYCAPQISGDDTTSAQTCTGAHTCSFAIPTMNLPACRLKTLQACKANSDCASLLCQTFFVDQDGDGYGQTGKTMSFCEIEDARTPDGYATRGGDCCDSDANAFPGQTKYFSSADACGSWDYNCDGTIQGSIGLVTYATVPVSECGTNGIGCGDDCTETASCR